MDQWGKYKDGQIQTYKPCNLTQSPEKFICLNQECRQNEKKQVQCYECLSKQHMGKNKVIRHHDDFIELDKFMQQIQVKCSKKESFLNILILNCNDFQKEKLQQIELAYKAEIAKSARIQIEKEVDSFISILGEELMKLKSFLIYSQSKHAQLVQCYFENEQNFIENIKSQYKILVETVSSLVLSLDCDIKLQLKKLEEKTKLIQNQMKNYNKGFLNSPLILQIILPFFFSFLLNYYYFDQQIEFIKDQFQKFSSEQQIYKSFPSEIQQIKIDQGFMNDSVNKLASKINQEELQIIEGQENLEKLKLRFDSYKKSSQTQISEIRNQIIFYQDNKEGHQVATQNIDKLDEKFNNFIKLKETETKNFQSIIQALNQTLTQEIDRNNQLRYQIFKESIDSTLEGKTLDNNLTISINSKTRKQQLIEENSDLVAKIHLHLSISRFSKFTLLYDHFFEKYIALTTMEKIKNIATQDNQDPLICVGGLNATNLTEFIVVACDFASEVFQSTQSERQARKSKNGEIYWYKVDERSFGFSPNQNITLTLCDDYDPEDERRFSVWHGIRVRDGGRRIGKEGFLISSKEYKMQIYMLR